MSGTRFTLIFALPVKLQTPIRNLAATLAALILGLEIEIPGFTVWPSLGWTKGYGIERGATVEFIAPDYLRSAVELAAAVCTDYCQDTVYLACGSGAVLVNNKAEIVEVLAEGSRFTYHTVTGFNTAINQARDSE